jgi:biopolymer transport protein ExbB/TolQ
MKNLFFMGGTGFMSILTLLFIISVAWTIYHFVLGTKPAHLHSEKTLQKLNYGKSIGLFALIVGILGQLVGLSAMFSAIAQVQKVEANLVFEGIRATMIVTIYGILIYLISLALWIISKNIIENKACQ